MTSIGLSLGAAALACVLAACRPSPPAAELAPDASVKYGAAGNYAFPVGPATLNGVACGTFPNLVCDGGAVAQLSAVTIGPDAGDGGAVTYAMLAGNRYANMDTSAGLVATATLGAATGTGECHTFRWWNWNGSQVPPVVTSDAGMVPFSGQSAGGSAGLVTTSSIVTPGAPYTLCADGTEWVSP